MKPASGGEPRRAGALERMLRIHQADPGRELPHRQVAGGANSRSAPSPSTGTSSSCGTGFSCRSSSISTGNGFRYTEEVSAFPTLQITEGELFALVIAEKALQQYRGTSFEKPLLSALRKMQQSLPDTISISLDEVDRTISFRTRAEPMLGPGDLRRPRQGHRRARAVGDHLPQARASRARAADCRSLSSRQHQRRVVSFRL